MKYGELTLGQIEAVVNKLGGMNGVRQLLSGETIVKLVERATNLFPVSINYDLSVEAMVRAGEYNWQNSDITERNFPSEEKGVRELELHLIHFNRVMSSDDVLRELEKRGLRPATLKELLTFGALYKEEQRKYPIVALGSVWQRWGGHRGVPFLRGDSGGRDLGLRWLAGGWSGHCRFLAVSK